MPSERWKAVDNLWAEAKARCAAGWVLITRLSNVSVQPTYCDGGGNRVKETGSGTTTIYINQFYDKNVTSGEVTTHYYLGGKEVALRKGSNTYFLIKDQIGSTAVVTDYSGNSVASMRYYPYGDCRNSTGTIPTDKKFTGQRLDSTGLYFYNARYYDPGIGRFISADTIVPSTVDPQAWNRYS